MTRHTDGMKDRMNARLHPLSDRALAEIALELEGQTRFADAALVWAELDRRETVIQDRIKRYAMRHLRGPAPARPDAEGGAR